MYVCKTWKVTQRITRYHCVILNELCRGTQEKMVAVQIKLQEWKWTGHAVREDSSATEKQAVNWNSRGQHRREDLESTVGK